MKIRSIAVALSAIVLAFPALQVAAQESVSLYRDCFNEGGGASLGAGSWDMGALASAGLNNDDISSIIVDKGFVVTAYEHAGFQGRALLFVGPTEVPCLKDHGFDNEISSFQIEDER